MTQQSTRIPEPGDKAPEFTLNAHHGGKVSLSDFRGAPVVLYFYPKDDTSGCTIEAKEFRDHMEEFENAGVTVVGVSPDDPESHCRFIDKHSLNFVLLSDSDHRCAEAYGVWVEKNSYGKKRMGVQRATFLIGPEGRIVRVWPKVKPEGHAQELLEAVGAMS